MSSVFFWCGSGLRMSLVGLVVCRFPLPIELLVGYRFMYTTVRGYMTSRRCIRLIVYLGVAETIHVICCPPVFQQPLFFYLKTKLKCGLKRTNPPHRFHYDIYFTLRCQEYLFWGHRWTLKAWTHYCVFPPRSQSGAAKALFGSSLPRK
jgi:hypothetical protein